MASPLLRFGAILRGRDAALAELVNAVAGGVAVVDVVAPEGAGRTRILHELAERLRSAGRHVEELVASDTPGAVTLAPVVASEPVRSAPDGETGDAAWSVARTVLEALARDPAPRVLLVDDAERLDGLSADILLAACRRTLAQVVVARRAGTVPHGSLARLVDGDAVRVELRPLPDDELAVLLQDALGQVDPITVHRLVERAAGRPAWLRAAVRAGLGSGSLTERFGVWLWDGTVQVPAPDASTLEVLASLPSDAGAAVRLLALARELTVPEWQRLLDEATVDAAFGTGLVGLGVSGRRHVVRFTHQLAADRLVAVLAPHERLALGRRLLAVADEAPGRRADDGLRLLLPAFESGVPLPVDALLDTARALRRHGPAGVESVARAAVAAADETGDERSRHDARWLLADALEKQGRHDDALEVLRADEPGDDDVRTRRRVQIAMNALWAGAGAASTAHAALVDAQVDTVGGDELVATLTWARVFAGEAAEAVDIARTLQAHPRCGALARVWSTTALVVGLGLLGRAGEIDGPLAAARAAAEAELGHEPYATDQLGWAEVFAQVLAGRVNVAASRADDGYRGALLSGDAGRVGGWASVAALAASAGGRFGVAVARLRETQALLDPTGTGGAYGAGALAGSHLGACLAQQGEVAAGRRAVEQARSFGVLSSDGVGAFRVWFERDAAWVGLSTPAALLDAARAAAHAPAMALTGAVDAARLGAWRDAAPVIRELAARVDGPAGDGWTVAVDALESDRAGGAGLERAAEVLALGGNVVMAAELLELAAGRRPPAEAARIRLARDALLRQTGPLRTPLLTTPGLAALTRRELDVALLAARGLSSREIADRLGLSPRTVDNHLGRVYLKLAIADRGELAALLAGADEDGDAG